MSIPVPSVDIYDATSYSSQRIAQTVCRTWKNVNSATWNICPEIIDLRPDGTGTVGWPFSVYTTAGRLSKHATQEFTWRLLQDVDMDGHIGNRLDSESLYRTMPKLVESTKAWTHKPWTTTSAKSGAIPAFVSIDLVGQHSLEAHDLPSAVTDFRTHANDDAVHLPTELIEDIFKMAASEEVAASELLCVCKWTRELVLPRRRRGRISLLTKQLDSTLAFWLTCGHFNPSHNPEPNSFFGLCAAARIVGRSVTYYSCELPITIPAQPNSDSKHWRAAKYYDEHPEVCKEFTT